jgi:hypothetical protein
MIEAGTSDHSITTVGVWSLPFIMACQQHENLSSDFQGFKVDSSVSCIEFWKGNPIVNLCPLWAGLNSFRMELFAGICLEITII